VWQAITGVALLALLGLHFVAHHFVVEGGLRNFQQVQEYIGNPLILTLEVLFLIAVTPHALLGVRAILFDLQLSEALERLIDRALWVVGIATVLYGFWLTWAIVTYPAG
jgi:succinate dehydrogenase / fumarate reductase membrane anchor subunit